MLAEGGLFAPGERFGQTLPRLFKIASLVLYLLIGKLYAFTKDR
jgi:hypothetical protein